MCTHRMIAALPVVLAFAFIGAFTTSRSKAGTAIIARDSRTFTEGQVGSTPFSVSDSTKQTGTFDLIAEKDLTADDGSGAAVHAKYTQTSTLELLPSGLLHAAGQFSTFETQTGAGPDDDPAGPTKCSGASFMSVNFKALTKPAPFQLTASFTNNLPDIDSARVFLFNDSTNNLIFRVSNGGQTANSETKTGFIEPGIYRLEIEAAAGSSTDGSTQSNSINFDFVVGNPIPLPPALLSGALGLIALAGVNLRRRVARCRSSRTC